MIELHDNELVFRFPEVHENAVYRINFQRTLRIPDDNREFPLPPGLGRFPLAHVRNHASRVPREWVAHGGAMLPMYQAEALWIRLSSDGDRAYPFAVKIAAGKLNAVTGEAWSNELCRERQDYVVAPDQPWLDGFCVQKGLVRQFVAMPLGQGYTAEEQITGVAVHGGLQIIVYPMKRERYEELLKQWADWGVIRALDTELSLYGSRESASMGLAAGGLMRQEIYEDKHGHGAWDTAHDRCFVHILNSTQWQAATGMFPPGSPPSAADYTKAGLPWFEHYDDSLNALDGAKRLAGLDSVAAKGIKRGENPLPENEAITPNNVVQVGPNAGKVSNGTW